MIGSQSGHDRGGRMKDTVQEVRHLSAQYARTTRAYPAHRPPYGIIKQRRRAAIRESVMIIAIASTNAIIVVVVVDDNTRHRGFA
jgi:hypothetical protein